jgi:putative acetyltransferase
LQFVPQTLALLRDPVPLAMAQPQIAHPRLLIRSESPDQPEVLALLRDLDDYLGSLYAPQDNHILEPAALRSPQVHFVVARVDGVAVGCGASRRMPAHADSGALAYGEIKRMMVHPAARGQGVGAALLARLEQQLRADGLSLALLETGAAQGQALRLYERSGYRRRPPFAGYPDNGLSLFYQKRLQP